MTRWILLFSALVLTGCASNPDPTSDEVRATAIDDTRAIEEIVYDGQDVVEGKEPLPQIVVGTTQLDEKVYVTPTPANSRQIKIVKQASLNSPAKFRKGMNHLIRDCNMRSKPTVLGSVKGVLLKGKKVWTESANKHWAKVYRKSGEAAYVYKGCF